MGNNILLRLLIQLCWCSLFARMLKNEGWWFNTATAFILTRYLPCLHWKFSFKKSALYFVCLELVSFLVSTFFPRMWVCIFLEGLSFISIPGILILLIGKESTLENRNCSAKEWAVNRSRRGRRGSITLRLQDCSLDSLFITEVEATGLHYVGQESSF